jgi:hypothetical protein
MAELSEKLKSLGVKKGARDLTPPPPSNTCPIEDVMPGRFVHAHSGSTYIVESSYPADYLHGAVDINFSSPLHMLAQWAGDQRIVEIPPSSFAFLDTETSGLAGGTGTFAF